MGGYVSFFNASSAFSDAELQSALPDLQSQVSNEYNYYWGLNSYLDINGGGNPIIIVDYPGAGDPQGALGYHYIDGNFQPYGVIFAGLCRDYGYSTTGVLSHELLELLADQQTDTVNLVDNGDGTGFIVIQEVCDPCEMSLYYEGPNGNIVSDFALPGWWVPGYPYQVDFLGAIPGPLQLATGGYISYQSVSLSGWQQISADKAQADIAKAADAVRSQITSSGNPRVDLVRQLQLGRSAEQRQPAAQQAQLGHRAAQQRQTTTERRQQPARQPSQMTVVRRQDVPEVGETTRAPQTSPQQRQQPSRASSKNGPKAQTVSS